MPERFERDPNILLRRLIVENQSKSEPVLKPIKPTTIGELMNISLHEEGGLHFTEAPIYPFAVQEENGRKPHEFIAVVAHTLREYQVLHFLNRFVAVKRDLSNSPDYWSRDVAADWSYMISKTTIGKSYREKLEKDHAPENVPGFNEFRPHVKLFVDALANQEMIEAYEIPVNGYPLIPVIHWDTSELRGHRWKWDLVGAGEKNQRRIDGYDINRLHFDKFAGMAMPPYIYPEATKDWEKEQHEQPMSIAQGPVHNWQHKDEHFDAPFMGELTHYIQTAI